jgi:hypothetical protein
MARRMQRHRRFPSTSEISFFAKHGLTGHGQWRVGGSKVKKGCVSGGVKVDTKRILNVIMILFICLTFLPITAGSDYGQTR